MALERESWFALTGLLVLALLGETMKQIRIQTILLLAGVVLMAGCSGGATVSDSEKVSDGASKTKVTADGQVYEGDGYSFMMPKSWKVIDPKGGDFKKAIADLKADKNMTAMASGLDQVLANKQFKLFSYMPHFSASGFAANLNVLEIPVGQDLKAQQVFDENLKQLKGISKSAVTSEQKKFGSADAIVAHWSMETMGKPMNFTSAVAWHNKTQYVFTFTVPSQFKDKATAEIDQVLSSVVFK